ncbi:MAG TPA: MBL fold metallo-hydrolase [Solirubrobacteraceae bacterium]|jgi:glyoxylase-like metal-dependent hydrolase (beta-lactamase superfamily II)|nr:MBL fold metallo-hydrolase [Solirubrobacteraceae bacterium]
MADRPVPLTFDIYVAPSVPTAGDDLPPGATERLWSPISSTLISGRREAVLVDALLTVSQARDLADWVAAHGKRLTAVYITHGHGDHWFGLATILDRFPEAHALAVPQVVEQMQRGSAAAFLASFWQSRFPGQIPDDLVLAEPMRDPAIELEGHDLVAVRLGHTDTDETTCLDVPAIGLVVAGDAAYNDVHLYLAESGRQGRRDWISALDTIESLQPRAVIAGHKRPGRNDHPRIIEETRQYIRDFDHITQTAGTARELYDRMLALHPHRINPGALWGAARAAKPPQARTAA